jgi:hypothetical protein
MAFPRKLKELCTPAFLYFVLSMIGIIASIVQNLGNRKRYDLGMLSARVPDTTLVFIVKIIYILFWTWILNLMCKDGHKEIAWFLVLIPFILLFVVVAFMSSSSYEGFDSVNPTSDELANEQLKMQGMNTPLPGGQFQGVAGVSGPKPPKK